MDLFAEETDTDNSKVKPLSFEQYQKLIAQLGKRSKDKDAILPIQIAYFTDLRLGEVAGLIWQDIKLEEQCLTRKQQLKNRMQYGELYHRNFYREVTEKNRVHYEYYNLGMAENVPEDYTKIFFVCLREDGCLELPVTVETARQRQEKYQNWKASISTQIHLHNKPVIKRGTAKKYAGTFGTLGCKHYHECLCTRYKRS